MPADAADLTKLLVDFDDKLGDFQDFLNTVAKATDHEEGTTNNDGSKA